MATKEKKGKEIGGSIDETIKQIEKKFGEGTIITLNQASMDVESIPTGSFSLDMALGVGGFPRGRIIEVFGPEMSGKTTLALHTVAEAQKTGGLCAYIDTEHALDPLYAKKLGVDTKTLLVSQPENGEQAFDIIESFILTNKFAVIVVDSVASLVPKAEIEGEMGDPQVGRHAKLMSHGIRKLVPIISNSKTVVIFINQIRQMIGQMYGPSEFTTGGKALKFYSSVRLDIRRIAQIKKGDEIVGNRTRVKVVKNKVAPPFRQTEFDIMYGQGISHEGEILALGEKYKIITKTGNTYYFNADKLGVGYNNAVNFLKGYPDTALLIKDLIYKELSNPLKNDSESTVEETKEEGNL